MTRIRFHIGAHKTATTHLQLTLAGCRLAPGTRYVPLKRLRRWLISPIRKGRPHLPWHRWHTGTWLFSDENILGTTANALRMYPDPAAALKYFVDCDLSLFLCVRSYESFLPSAWGERLWHHEFQPFEAKLPVRRWTDVVADLRSDLPGVPIHVWRYEHYREHAEAIARYYADNAIERFPTGLVARPKSGFSARAVAELGQCSGSRVGKRRLERVRARFPVGKKYPRFDPWTEAQKSELRDMYRCDLEQIAAMARVWQP
ncbi:hypothetical protein G4Y73_05425 [Wenzhouxiangella sp. XN201]|uniref:hypothetical protein n=1 Tax=Wenzhouxiangella sp. XN201 TaxID=2710755 RepID=UPI0013C68564|nr:hypothetical protein [Wenzhouxiangella sp. XN201]NEZ03592.1 hypothetical protein [Wenzhouxiangella sp. XN201]